MTPPKQLRHDKKTHHAARLAIKTFLNAEATRTRRAAPPTLARAGSLRPRELRSMTSKVPPVTTRTPPTAASPSPSFGVSSVLIFVLVADLSQLGFRGFLSASPRGSKPRAPPSTAAPLQCPPRARPKTKPGARRRGSLTLLRRHPRAQVHSGRSPLTALGRSAAGSKVTSQSRARSAQAPPFESIGVAAQRKTS